MMRRAAAGVALAASLTLLAGSLPQSAGADVAVGAGSAHSQAAQVTQGSGISTTPTIVVPATSVVTAALGVLGINAAQLTSTLATAVVTPLTNALTGLPRSISTSLSDGLVGAGLQADSPASQQPRPATGTYPTCGQQGWTTSDCYGPVTPGVAGAPAVTLSTGSAQGYATGDSVGYLAAAHVADPQLSLLSIAIGDLGVIDSTAQCALTTSSCGATQTLSGSSLLGGHLTYSLADGGALIAKVDGVPVPAAGQTVTANGVATVVTATGALLTLKIGLSLPQLLTGLGLPNLLNAVSTLGTLTDGGTVATMTVTVGPGNISRTSPASAWGLDVAVDLSADVKLNLVNTLTLPLLGRTTVTLATVEVKTSGTPPDVVDLKLAYSTATAGTLLPGWVPAGLV